eukprot:CAMPEP_0119106236 /NCGR_PEP_ID=MMETSP1180-20130426/3988_1 /TAXON_ID=3052 ORGANISM="Chlamydomonas cf sp, Strain CCMP681" /NCGR_SAMPLE_ID=MMETSP1180 /ASSEMBLY_ACC=CAM_ASM_000741 /LENGTH=98 /DNA_ID=CAMNT_0007091519 /DNA_START=219 /DNA_END=515 /DNA_ORIENTATION=-
MNCEIGYTRGASVSKRACCCTWTATGNRHMRSLTSKSVCDSKQSMTLDWLVVDLKLLRETARSGMPIDVVPMRADMPVLGLGWSSTAGLSLAKSSNDA